MKNLNAFYIIGTVGMIVTAVLHIALAVLTPHPSTHPVFIGLYPTFFAFLIIGAAQLKLSTRKIPVEKEKKQSKLK